MKKRGPEKKIVFKYLVCLDQDLLDKVTKISKTANIDTFKSMADIYRTALNVGFDKMLEEK